MFVAATQHVPQLYVLAGFSFVLKVVLVPAIVLRVLCDARVDLAASNRLGVATMVLLAIAISVFGFFVVGSLPSTPARFPPLRSAWPQRWSWWPSCS